MNATDIFRRTAIAVVGAAAAAALATAAVMTVAAAAEPDEPSFGGSALRAMLFR